MKYWETIANRLSKAGWSWGCVSALDSAGRTIFIADAHRDDGKRFVVQADEANGVSGTGIGDLRLRRIVLTGWRVFSKLGVAKRILNQAEDIFLARFFASSRPATFRINAAGKRKRKKKS